jgi:hypothetical protein
MCTAKSLSSANQLNEASKHLLNKKQTGEQQSTSQPVKQSTNNPINKTMSLQEPFQLTQTRQVKISIPSQVLCMKINLTYKVAAF